MMLTVQRRCKLTSIDVVHLNGWHKSVFILIPISFIQLRTLPSQVYSTTTLPDYTTPLHITLSPALPTMQDGARRLSSEMAPASQVRRSTRGSTTSASAFWDNVADIGMHDLSNFLSEYGNNTSADFGSGSQPDTTANMPYGFGSTDHSLTAVPDPERQTLAPPQHSFSSRPTVDTQSDTPYDPQSETAAGPLTPMMISSQSQQPTVTDQDVQWWINWITPLPTEEAATFYRIVTAAPLADWQITMLRTDPAGFYKMHANNYSLMMRLGFVYASTMYPDPGQQLPTYAPYFAPAPAPALAQRQEDKPAEAPSSRRSTSGGYGRRTSSTGSYANRSATNTGEEHWRGAEQLAANKRKSVAIPLHSREQLMGQKPKKDPTIAHHRPNATTLGKTTRTGKINEMAKVKANYPEIAVHPQLKKGWTSKQTKNTYKYTAQGEWKKETMSAAEIRDFILEYPQDKDKGVKLNLWIQRAPADSGTRYPTQTWSQCRFSECPMRKQGGPGTILHGHYRVAFDEQSYAANKYVPYDPHLAAGAYTHLYCFERFLDLEYICKKANVLVDNRTFAQEPKGNFQASLAGQAEFEPANSFVGTCIDQLNINEVPDFKDYPRHKDYARNNLRKPHEQTLTFKMSRAKTFNRPTAQLKSFICRGLGPTHILLNNGDVDMYMQATIYNKKKAGKGRAKEDNPEEAAEYLEYKQRVATMQAIVLPTLPVVTDEDRKKKYRQTKPKTTNKRKLSGVDAEGETDSDDEPPRPRKRGRKARATALDEPWNKPDDGSSDEDAAPRKNPTTPTRRSNRNTTRSRKDYTEPDDSTLLPQEHVAQLQQYEAPVPIHAPAPGFVPGLHHEAVPHQQKRLSETWRPYPGAEMSVDEFNRQYQLGPEFEVDKLATPVDDAKEYFKSLGMEVLEDTLMRRASSIMAYRRSIASRRSIGTRNNSILRSTMSPATHRDPIRSVSSAGSIVFEERHASFRNQPVTRQQEFDTDAPPAMLEPAQTRRSTLDVIHVARTPSPSPPPTPRNRKNTRRSTAGKNKAVQGGRVSKPRAAKRGAHN
jgi:hypothetical protein